MPRIYLLIFLLFCYQEVFHSSRCKCFSLKSELLLISTGIQNFLYIPFALICFIYFLCDYPFYFSPHIANTRYSFTYYWFLFYFTKLDCLALFSAAIKRLIFFSFMIPFLCHIQVISYVISLVCHLYYVYSCFVSKFYIHYFFCVVFLFVLNGISVFIAININRN